MTFYALVTLDLIQATAEERKSFYEYLELRGATKLGLTTTFHFEQKFVGSRIEAKTEIENILSSASLNAKNVEYHYAMQLAEEKISTNL